MDQTGEEGDKVGSPVLRATGCGFLRLPDMVWLVGLWRLPSQASSYTFPGGSGVPHPVSGPRRDKVSNPRGPAICSETCQPLGILQSRIVPLCDCQIQTTLPAAVCLFISEAFTGHENPAEGRFLSLLQLVTTGQECHHSQAKGCVVVRPRLTRLRIAMNMYNKYMDRGLA